MYYDVSEIVGHYGLSQKAVCNGRQYFERVHKTGTLQPLSEQQASVSNMSAYIVYHIIWFYMCLSQFGDPGFINTKEHFGRKTEPYEYLSARKRPKWNAMSFWLSTEKQFALISYGFFEPFAQKEHCLAFCF
jgi:hypothetical protein